MTTPVGEHQWNEVERYGYGHQDKCAMCGAVRFYSWDPGWPGSYDYFSAGQNVKTPPPCSDGPLFNNVKR